MELVEGEDLATRITSGPLPIGQIRQRTLNVWENPSRRFRRGGWRFSRTELALWTVWALGRGPWAVACYLSNTIANIPPPQSSIRSATLNPAPSNASRTWSSVTP